MFKILQKIIFTIHPLLIVKIAIILKRNIDQGQLISGASVLTISVLVIGSFSGEFSWRVFSGGFLESFFFPCFIFCISNI